jgi:hypothetical protein
MFNARLNVRQGRRDRAAELFESKAGLQRLRLTLERYPEFRKDNNNGEEFYEFELRYIKLMQDKEGGNYKQMMAAGRLLGAAVPSIAPAPWPMLLELGLVSDASRMADLLPVPEFQPPLAMRIDAPGPDGKPFVDPSTVAVVRVRHGLLKEAPGGPPPGTPASRGGMRPSATGAPPQAQ